MSACVMLAIAQNKHSRNGLIAMIRIHSLD